MNLHEMVARTRSIRRFYESHRININTLISFVDMARLTASAANLQPLTKVSGINERAGPYQLK